MLLSLAYVSTTNDCDPTKLVKETFAPLNENNCNFVLNVTTNRDGLIDENTLAGLKEIGKL